MDNSLQARLMGRLESQPDRRAVGFFRASDETVEWNTVEQFHREAAGYAVQLARSGLGRGDVCLIVLPSTRLCAAMVLGALQLGAVPLLVAPPVLQGEGAYSNLQQILFHVMDRTAPAVVVCHASMADMRAALEAREGPERFVFEGEDIEEGVEADPSFDRPVSDDVAAMQLTSGTTGLPRICVWKQGNMLAAMDGMAAATRLNADDVYLNWTPLYHDMGLVNNYLLCLSSGTPLVLQGPKDFVMRPAIWLRGLSQTGANVTWSPNFGLAISAQRVKPEEMEGVRLDHIRAVWNAAEKIHLRTMRDFYERFSPYGLRYEALKTNFGCAENVGGATFSDPDGMFVHEHVDRNLLQEHRVAEPIPEDAADRDGVAIVGVGRPFPGMRVRILSEDGDPLPDGHVGEIALATPSRMHGYLGDEQATQRAIQGEYLRTGDLGYSRGEEVFWVGRVQERITVRGRKLDPSDFERLLLEVDGLRQGCFAAFGVDDADQGTQRIVLVTEVRDSTERSPGELAREIRSRTSAGLGVTLSEVVLVREGVLTKTSSGKRRHRHFQRLYRNGGLSEYEWEPHGA